jgi:hypothetical protein
MPAFGIDVQLRIRHRLQQDEAGIERNDAVVTSPDDQRLVLERSQVLAPDIHRRPLEDIDDIGPFRRLQPFFQQVLRNGPGIENQQFDDALQLLECRPLATMEHRHPAQAFGRHRREDRLTTAGAHQHQPVDAIRRPQCDHQRGRAAQRVTDEARLLNPDNVHEGADEVTHRLEDRTIFQLAFGLAKARQIDDDDPAAGSQRLDILSIVAEAGRPGPAAVDQDRRLALPDIMVTGTGSGDVDKLVG